MGRFLILVIGIALSAGFVLTSGCMDSGGPSLQALKLTRTQLMMAEEPEDELQTVVEVRNEILGITEEVQEEAAADDAESEAEDADSHSAESHDAEAHDHDAHVTGKKLEVVLIGSVGGLTNPWEKTEPDYPFRKSEAILFLADPEAVAEREASGHVHAPGEECAFCAAHAAETSEQIAMVRFLGENGKVVPLPAELLFEVEPNDMVVVKGTAQVIEGGMMVVDAKKLYIRK